AALPRGRRTSHFPGGHAEGFPDAFKQLDLAFYSFIGSGCTGQPRFPTFADGDREVRICETIAQSAREGKWVAVSSPDCREGAPQKTIQGTKRKRGPRTIQESAGHVVLERAAWLRQASITVIGELR